MTFAAVVKTSVEAPLGKKDRKIVEAFAEEIVAMEVEMVGEIIAERLHLELRHGVTAGENMMGYQSLDSQLGA